MVEPFVFVQTTKKTAGVAVLVLTGIIALTNEGVWVVGVSGGGEFSGCVFEAAASSRFFNCRVSCAFVMRMEVKTVFFG